MRGIAPCFIGYIVQALYQSTLHSLPLLGRGKVRDMYAIDTDQVLIVTSDRLSAFDVILDDPIPGKGAVLTALSNFWLEHLQHIVPNHATGIDPLTVVAADEQPLVQHRSMVAKRLKPILIECVVRGYIVGSGWAEYKQNGTVCGIDLPAGLQQAQQLAQPIFTPAAKAEVGAHDENVSFDYVVNELGAELAEKLRAISVQLYTEAADYAATKGIIIADTKFEFGLDEAGTLYLMDEVLTPDSSRFWEASLYQLGSNPPSLDKQIVRDWLAAQDWDKTAPAPRLPQAIITQTAAKYTEVARRLGAQLDHV